MTTDRFPFIVETAPGVPVVTAYEGEPHEEIGKATTLMGAIRIATKFLRRGDFAGGAGAWEFTWGSKTLAFTVDADGSISTRIA